MVFSEKLAFLMKLTSTSNKQLAEAVSVDPSLISRLRSRRREAPKNASFTKKMADYFARKCEGNYQRIALSEALGRKHLQIQMGTEQLSCVLFDWLAGGEDQVGQFLNTFERFSVENTEPDGVYFALPVSKTDASTFAYYGNDGKRGAVSAFLSYLLSLEQPGTVLLSTDESSEWLFEDRPFLEQLEGQMKLLLQRGFRICRIAVSLSSADQAFDSLTHWLPFYITGQVDSFYYPRLRDELYRRTLIVLPGAAAVVSTSTAGQPVGNAAILTRDPRLVRSFAGEFQALLQKCRPMMTTYSTAGGPEQLLSCISQFDSDSGSSIQQSVTLSSLTAPPELAELAAGACPEEEGLAIRGALARSRARFRQSLKTYDTVDIHSLATVEQVRAGAVPMGIGYLCQDAPLCYTPETYALHLESILGYLERYDRYHAVLLPYDAGTHSLFVKEGGRALLLRPGTPLIVFEVSQLSVAEACREYLLRRIQTPLSPAMARQNVMSALRAMIWDLRQGEAP